MIVARSGLAKTLFQRFLGAMADYEIMAYAM
jgi:hypothetical protein